VIPNNSHARNVPFAGFGENTDGGDMGVLLTAEGNGTGVEFQSPRIILTRTKAICSSRVAVQKARGSAAAVGSSRYKRRRHCLGVGA